MESMQTLYSTSNLAQADLLMTVLRNHGIDCVLDNQYGWYGIGMPTSVTPLVITVRAVDHGRASGVLRDALEGRLKGLEIPAEMLSTIRCGCGKDLEIPVELEDSGFECPWCGRATGPRPPA